MFNSRRLERHENTQDASFSKLLLKEESNTFGQSALSIDNRDRFASEETYSAPHSSSQGIAQTQLVKPEDTSSPLKTPRPKKPPSPDSFGNFQFESRFGKSLLTPLKRSHAKWLHENLFSNPEVLTWYRDGKGRNLEETLSFVQERERTWRGKDVAGWLVIAGGENAGFVGCKKRQADELEIGYAYAPRFWGKGLASSCLLAAITFLIHSQPYYKTIMATAHPDNYASNAVLKKTGFEFVKTFERDDYSGAPRNYYSFDLQAERLKVQSDALEEQTI